MQRVSIINLHAVNRSHKFWELLLATSPTRNCSNASTILGPKTSCLLPRASLPWGQHHAGDHGPWNQSPPPPCSHPREPLQDNTGKNPGVKTPLEATPKSLAGVCGCRYPSASWYHPGKKPSGHLPAPRRGDRSHRVSGSPRAPPSEVTPSSSVPAALQPGAPPSFPIAPLRYPPSADAHSRPAQRRVPGRQQGWKPQRAAAPRLGQRRGRKGPGTPDKSLLYCQSKVSR